MCCSAPAVLSQAQTFAGQTSAYISALVPALARRLAGRGGYGHRAASAPGSGGFCAKRAIPPYIKEQIRHRMILELLCSPGVKNSSAELESFIRILEMIRAHSILMAAIALASAVRGQPTERSIPAGTIVQVRNNQTIDSKTAAPGQAFSGLVTHDVTDRRGHVVIPGGSPAELVVRNVSKHRIALDLEAITIAGRRYQVPSEPATIQGGQKSGLGANKRTAKFVGGGALGGSVIGAIAGGGAGAAIGAVAGSAGGAAAQVLTKGKSVRVPAESLVTFRLTHAFSR